MTPRALTVRLLAVVLFAGIGLIATPAPADTPAQAKYANQVISAMNDKRENHGKTALKKNKCLKAFAVKQAKKMANQRRLFHQRLGPVARKCGFRSVAENVARGFPNGKAVVRAWMKSKEGHRQIVLSGAYRKVGVAARKAGGQWWVSAVFGGK